MGRPRLPTELKVLEGNRGKRALNKHEPEPDLLDNLDPPAWLPEDAKAVWRELAFKLRKAKVLTVLDVPALEKLSVHLAQWRRATLELRGLIPKDEPADGYKPMNGDWATEQSRNFKQSDVLLREFGMTPAARSRVMIDPQLGLFGDGNGQGKSASYFT